MFAEDAVFALVSVLVAVLPLLPSARRSTLNILYTRTRLTYSLILRSDLDRTGSRTKSWACSAARQVLSFYARTAPRQVRRLFHLR